MKPDDHSLLSQLVQLGLESLAAKASAALNGIAVDVPAEAPAESQSETAQPEDAKPDGDGA